MVPPVSQPRHATEVKVWGAGRRRRAPSLRSRRKMTDMSIKHETIATYHGTVDMEDGDEHGPESAVYDNVRIPGQQTPTIFCLCGHRCAGDTWADAGEDLDVHLLMMPPQHQDKE